MVPSEPMAAELWMSDVGVAPSRIRKLAVSNERRRLGSRGPACGLRPVCCGSIWYIGRPTTPCMTWGVGVDIGSGVELAMTGSGELVASAVGTGVLVGLG